MKLSARLCSVLFLVMFVAGLLVTPAKADTSTQALELTETEKYIKEEILSGREADLTGRSDQTLRGEVLVAWWKDPDFKNIPFFKIKNATIQGDVLAEGVSLPYAVGFTHCTFTNNINLESAQTKTFRIENDPTAPATVSAPSRIMGFLRMSRMIADGDVALYGSEFSGPVTLFDAQINGNLFAKDSKFNGTEWLDRMSKYPFELWKTHVAQSTEFTGSVFKGEVSADYAVFGADVKFDGATFEAEARFKNIQADDIVDFRGAVFQQKVTFENSAVKRDAQFTNASFAKGADFNYMAVGRFLNFSSDPLNKEDFTEADLAGFQGAHFNGEVKFEGVQVGKVLNFSKADYAAANQPFKVELAEVKGQTLFADFKSPYGLDLSHNQFGDLKITGGTLALFSLDSTLVNGDLLLQDISAAKFSAQDLTVKNSTTFLGLKVTDELDLSSSNLGSFILGKEPFWPAAQSTFNLRGTTYTDINFILSKDTKVEYQEFKGEQAEFLGNMVAASLYSPQTYRAFEAFLTEKGRGDDAAAMEYARRERARKDENILKPWSSPWLLSWFLYVFSGYGQHPEYALGWSMLIVIWGAIFFQLTGVYKDDEENADAKRKNTQLSNYKKFVYCLLYSAALFFPLKILDFAEKWEPQSDRTYFRLYIQIHAVLGMIIAPTAVLAFSGLIK